MKDVCDRETQCGGDFLSVPFLIIYLEQFYKANFKGAFPPQLPGTSTQNNLPVMYPSTWHTKWTKSLEWVQPYKDAGVNAS